MVEATKQTPEIQFRHSRLGMLYHRMVTFQNQLQEELPELSRYGFFKMMSCMFPLHTPTDLLREAFAAARDGNKNTAEAGKEMLIALNLRTIIRVVDKYTQPQENINGDERDELTMIAIGGAWRILSKGQVPGYISRRVNRAAADDIDTYLEKTGKEEANRERYLADEDYAFAGDPDITHNTVVKSIFSSDVDGALLNIPQQERIIIKNHYGINEEASSTRELADNYGTTPGRITTLLKSGITALGDNPQLDSWYLPSDQVIVPAPPLSPDQEDQKPSPQKSELELLKLSAEQITTLKAAGITTIPDFFSAKPEEIIEEWSGDPKEIVKIIGAVLGFLQPTYNRITKNNWLTTFDMRVLKAVSTAVIHREGRKNHRLLPQLFLNEYSALEEAIKCPEQDESILTASTDEIAPVSEGPSNPIRPEIYTQSPDINIDTLIQNATLAELQAMMRKIRAEATRRRKV